MTTSVVICTSQVYFKKLITSKTLLSSWKKFVPSINRHRGMKNEEKFRKQPTDVRRAKEVQSHVIFAKIKILSWSVCVNICRDAWRRFVSILYCGSSAQTIFVVGSSVPCRTSFRESRIVEYCTKSIHKPKLFPSLEPRTVCGYVTLVLLISSPKWKHFALALFFFRFQSTEKCLSGNWTMDTFVLGQIYSYAITTQFIFPFF